MVSLSGYASLNQDYLAPHDTLNSVVRTADGAHGLFELTFACPTAAKHQLARGGISVTGTKGWVSIDNATSVEGKGALVITVCTRQTDAQGRTTGETEEKIEKLVSGVSEEFKRFFKAIDGEDDGFGQPGNALKDVAFIQAALNSNGAPVDLVKLVQQ